MKSTNVKTMLWAVRQETWTPGTNVLDITNKLMSETEPQEQIDAILDSHPKLKNVWWRTMMETV